MALTEKYVSALAGGSGNGLTAGTAYTWAQMSTELKSLSGTGGQGIRYNIKADGTYSFNTNINDNGSSLTGTPTNPIHLRGYKTTIGDGYLGRTPDNGALITTNMPLCSYGSDSNNWYGGKHFVMESLQWSSNAHSGTGVVSLEANGHLFGCVITNGGTGGGFVLREGGVAFECDVFLTATSGADSSKFCVEMQGQGALVDSCRLIASDGQRSGVNTDRVSTIYGTLIKGGGGGTGVNTGTDSYRNVHVRNCTITGWIDGFRFNNSADFAGWIAGNMVTDNSGYAVNLSVATYEVLIGPNRVRDNVLGTLNAAPGNWPDMARLIPLVTTDTGGPETDYTNAAGNNYNPIAASPGRNVNRPFWLDMGAYDMKDPTGGGTAVFNPLASTIIESMP